MLEIINGYTIVASADIDGWGDRYRTVMGTMLDETGEHKYVVATALRAEYEPGEWRNGQYFDSPYEAGNVRFHYAQRAFDRKVHVEGYART